jgi:hypothetical protein
MMKLERDVAGTGISFELSVPDDWLEYPVEGTPLALAGSLGEPEGSMRPNVTVAIDEVDSPDAGFDAMVSAFRELPEAEVGADERGRSGKHPAAVLAGAWRHGDTGATVVQTVAAVAVRASTVAGSDGPILLVRATGTCGGAASPDVIARLTEVAQSLRVVGGES